MPSLLELTPSLSVYATLSFLMSSSVFLMSVPFLLVESMIFSNCCITSVEHNETTRGGRAQRQAR